MEHLIGWGLLSGFLLLVGLLIRFAGGPPGEPRATCGPGGCGTSGTRRRRA